MGDLVLKHQYESVAKVQWTHVRKDKREADVPFLVDRHYTLKKDICVYSYLIVLNANYIWSSRVSKPPMSLFLRDLGRQKDLNEDYLLEEHKRPLIDLAQRGMLVGIDFVIWFSLRWTSRASPTPTAADVAIARTVVSSGAATTASVVPASIVSR